jgi:TonB family protein
VATGYDGPVPVSRPPPRYPRDALRRNVGGMVRVKVTVATDGSVERLELAEGSGSRELDRAALEAVRRWTFRPAMRDGQAVTASIVVPLEFRPDG